MRRVQQPKTDTWGKRVKDGHRLLDQPFNPVTLSRRQTVCYRSFHYVSQLQIALKVRRTRSIRGGEEEKKKPSRVRRYYKQSVLTPTLSHLQISAGSWKQTAGGVSKIRRRFAETDARLHLLKVGSANGLPRGLQRGARTWRSCVATRKS